MKKVLLIVPVLVVAVIGGLVVGVHHVEDAPPPTLALTPALVFQGGEVRLTATGFFPEEPIDIRVEQPRAGVAGLDLQETQASLQGNLDAVNLPLPDDVTSGVHLVQLVGRFSGRQSTAQVYVRARSPWLTIDPGEMKPVAPFGLVVGGFTPGELVQVLMQPVPPSGSTSTPSSAKATPPLAIAELPTDLAGNSSYFQLKIPFREPGDYLVLVRGEKSGQALKKKITLSPYSPTFDLSPWFGPPGLRVQLNARGYAPGEQVQIFVGSAAQPAATATADQYGNFWGAGNVPVPYQVFAGPLDIRAIGVDSGATTTRQFAVEKPKPWLELSTWYGAPSAPVFFSGGGWAAGEQIGFRVDSLKNPVIAVGRADAYGWLHDSGPIYVPRDATNQVTFIAVGEQSHSVASAKFAVVLPFGLRPGS